MDTPPKEMELIYHLASNPNRVFTGISCWTRCGASIITATAVRWMYVKRLRKKLEGVSDKWALKTVWGVGYKFEVRTESPAAGSLLQTLSPEALCAGDG